MKKLFILIAIAAVFTACSSAPEVEAPKTDSTAVACDTTPKCCAKADSAVVDTTKK